MAPRTDNARLTEAQICELVGTSQQRRQTWVSRKLLHKAGTRGCGLRDALELAQLLRLMEILGPTDAVVAWRQVREQLASPFPTTTLDVIFDVELKTAEALTDDARARALIAHGRPVRLRDLRRMISPASPAQGEGGMRREMRLLDLFCGAGGCSMGYHRAGFDVVGVDIHPQPNYPFEFHQRDAMDTLEAMIGGFGFGGFDAIHASPPCQPHSSLTGWGGSRRVPEREDLIPVVRELLARTALPYVIENVEGSGLHNAIRICGQGLGLRVRRHRRFESNVPMMSVQCRHTEPPVIVVRGSIGRRVFDPRRKAIAPSLVQAREVMGMPWATASELADAIPPAYTEHIGGYLMAEINARAAVGRPGPINP